MSLLHGGRSWKWQRPFKDKQHDDNDDKKHLKNVGPIRRYIAIHQVSLLSHASYSYSAGGVRCPRQRRRQRQRVTEETAMAPWNGPNDDDV